LAKKELLVATIDLEVDDIDRRRIGVFCACYGDDLAGGSGVGCSFRTHVNRTLDPAGRAPHQQILSGLPVALLPQSTQRTPGAIGARQHPAATCAARVIDDRPGLGLGGVSIDRFRIVHDLPPPGPPAG
jgi:hypothetical protein